MLEAISTAVVLGFWAGVAPGPLLVFLIGHTLRHGPREGIKVSFVPLLTDAPIIILSVAVLARWSQVETLLGMLAFGGGGFLIFLAYDCFRTGVLDLAESDAAPRSIRQGMTINFLNPHPYLFWILVGSPKLVQWADAFGPGPPVVFIVLFYALLVGIKIIIALGLGRARVWLSSKGYVYTMWLLGVLMVLFAGLLFRDGARYLGWLGAGTP